MTSSASEDIRVPEIPDKPKDDAISWVRWTIVFVSNIIPWILSIIDRIRTWWRKNKEDNN